MAGHLTIYSYNCTGFGPGKPEYVSELIKAHDFVLLQEHWLSKSQFLRIKKIKMLAFYSPDYIPHTTKQCNSKVIAGWNEHVKPYRETSVFWHNAWKDCGSPRSAVIADVMHRSRSQYHRAVRFVKRNTTNVKKEGMATALFGNKKSWISGKKLVKLQRTRTILCYSTSLMK